MTSITVVRSVYGDYDFPEPIPPQSHEFAEVMVNEAICPRPHVHARLAAKHAKCLPWDYSASDMYVWIDGSFTVTSPDWLDFLLVQSEGHPISQYKHVVRDDILIEADVSSTMEKYRGQEVHQQANYYLSLGHPRYWGLWATGVIVYRTDAQGLGVLSNFGNRWLAEQVRWTYQDQISQPHVLRLHELRPYEIEDQMYASAYMTMRGHNRED